MKLKKLIIKNFRSYKDFLEIDIDKNLTTFIGKNDIGKSTILEALAIFFEHPSVKPEKLDLCKYADGEEFVIGCVFEELPKKLVIDSTFETTLEDEYLTTKDGKLEIHKLFKSTTSTPKPKVFAVANHPTQAKAKDLLSKKRDDLRAIISKLGIDTQDVNLNKCAELRKAIRGFYADLKLQSCHISLDKEDGKKLWDQIQKELPFFALFKSDRPSTDEDSEFQDPMKIAVQQALYELENQLEDIKSVVKCKTEEVAKRTIEGLKDLDSTLASQLTPNFKADPKWSSIFKLSLTGDNDIPVNKRGSGVRRLILLSFFRAEVERLRNEEKKKNVIYAIEEPETSQHPENQISLIESLNDLADEDHCQILLTTHVPALAGLVPQDSIRYIQRKGVYGREIMSGNEDTYRNVSNNLGIHPDKRVQVLICVEGPNDVSLLKHVSRIIYEKDKTVLDINNDHRVMVIPLGGTTLKDWVSNQYLKKLNLPEVHIYDTDDKDSPTYKKEYDEVNSRENGAAFLTKKKEFENYFHEEAIKSIYEGEFSINDNNDVAKDLAKLIHESSSETDTSWTNLNDKIIKKKVSKVKKRLYRECLKDLDYRLLERRNAIDEFKEWFSAAKSFIK